MLAEIDNGTTIGFRGVQQSRYSSWKGGTQVSTYVGEHMQVSERGTPRRGIIRYAVVSTAIVAAVFYLFTASTTINFVYTALRRSIQATTATVTARPETPSLVVIARRPAATLTE